MDRKAIVERVASLGPFYHNISLPNGVQTAPAQETPARGENWEALVGAIPADLSGKTVLDIGCNAGAFSVECKRRGASRVLGIDYSAKFIEQARFCAELLELDIEYQTGELFSFLPSAGQFDVVIFVGVLYHLQDPIGAARLVRKCTREMLLLETVGVDPKLRKFEEGIIQLPRPRITHSGSTWINREGLRHIFVDVAKFGSLDVLFDGSRIGALLRV